VWDGGGARRRGSSSTLDPGHRCRHRRRARAGRGAAVVRWPSATRPRPSPAAPSACRACSSSSDSTRASVTTRHSSTRVARARRGDLSNGRDRPAPALTAELIDIPSPSASTRVLVDHARGRARGCSLARPSTGWATTWWPARRLGRDTRVVLAGHTDTVPANDNADGRIEGDTLWGVGSTDMKGGIGGDARPGPHGGRSRRRRHLRLLRPRRGRRRAQRAGRALRGSAPTCSSATSPAGRADVGAIEAGCQGTMRHVVGAAGRRAHTARPWMGATRSTAGTCLPCWLRDTTSGSR
jgi:hypothetical protein